MTAFSERQRAELRDAAARSRLEALAESRRLATQAPKAFAGEGGVNESSPARRSADVTSEADSGRTLLASSTSPPAASAEADPVLLLPEAQEIIRRIGDNVDPDYPHRAEHVAQVAAVVVKAKMQPTNAYAKPTL